ncbi:hypothetical protein HOF65_01945 [bacterium]|nr:hypothetical protein [bacterium]MBT3852774.1 hypothetical protein [bacterium]MBT4633353.1 hypothetical protein [bacterium]MBT6778796.1 hypothetical protein [bacterium]
MLSDNLFKFSSNIDILFLISFSLFSHFSLILISSFSRILGFFNTDFNLSHIGVSIFKADIHLDQIS